VYGCTSDPRVSFLIEVGELLLAGISDKLEGCKRSSRIWLRSVRSLPACSISLPNAFGTNHILPLLPAFLRRHPAEAHW
jgi:DNA-binding transcriptional LysR family regulator